MGLTGQYIWVSDSSIFDIISGSYKLNVTGELASNVSIDAKKTNIASISIEDSAKNITSYLDYLQKNIQLLNEIIVTPLTPITASSDQFNSNFSVFNKLSGVTSVFVVPNSSLDIVNFPLSSSNYTIKKITAADSFNLVVNDSTNTKQTYTLNQVERIHFPDLNLAFDLSGNAGCTAEILGAVFGPSAISNRAYVGIGLNLLDKGTSLQNLVILALNVVLGPNITNEQEIQLINKNIFGSSLSSSTISSYINMITSGQYSQADFAIMEMQGSQNLTNINLTGLIQTGIAYTS